MNKPRFYEIRAIVAEKDVATVFDLLKDHAPPRILPVDKPETIVDKPATSRKGYAGGVKNKGITGQDLVALILSNSPRGHVVTAGAFRQAFVGRGFAAHSASSALSQMRKLGEIRFDGRGYCATEKMRNRPIELAL